MTSSHFTDHWLKSKLSSEAVEFCLPSRPHAIMGKLIHLLLALGSIVVSIDCVDRDYDEPLFLSDYILRGDSSTARDLSLVRHREMEWLTSYAGYITVNKQLSSNMFFWYFPAKYGAATAPLVLWLQGKGHFTVLYASQTICTDSWQLKVFFLNFRWTRNIINAGWASLIFNSFHDMVIHESSFWPTFKTSYK